MLFSNKVYVIVSQLNSANPNALSQDSGVDHFVWLSTDFIIFYCFGWRSM